MIAFACISPHPPLLLPGVGPDADKKAVKNTLAGLQKLGKKMARIKPGKIVISSPHPDWGFDVPLYFLAQGLKIDILPLLTDENSPADHFEKGREYWDEIKNMDHKVALVASGDLSHRLKPDGPYGFHEQGPEFDKKLIDSLNKKDIKSILRLNDLYPEAGECGGGR